MGAEGLRYINPLSPIEIHVVRLPGRFLTRSFGIEDIRVRGRHIYCVETTFEILPIVLQSLADLRRISGGVFIGPCGIDSIYSAK